jgi:hypothetical protein
MKETVAIRKGFYSSANPRSIRDGQAASCASPFGPPADGKWCVTTAQIGHSFQRPKTARCTATNRGHSPVPFRWFLSFLIRYYMLLQTTEKVRSKLKRGEIINR